jgi:hypothetical protein
MVSFSDEALETFSPKCMESSSIRSMGGVVHRLLPRSASIAKKNEYVE